jgi:hypothetical protein
MNPRCPEGSGLVLERQSYNGSYNGSRGRLGDARPTIIHGFKNDSLLPSSPFVNRIAAVKYS